ncbi:MAPEG family protein [Vandammella animalimorsus]|nr:MAPEG family protein [Vandammella animalimorsus]
MNMNYVHIVALLAIAQFLAFGALVGRMRAKYGVKAPAMTGHEMFERALRVQMNTLEQLVCFLPALLIASLYWPNAVIAAIGVVYLAGRLLYCRQYLADPASRAPGFLLSVIPNMLLLLAALAGALLRQPA